MDYKNVKILVVGVGGLGCPASLALADSGVGTLGLMDFDRVEISNLHRQILYGDQDLGRPKAEAAFDFFKSHYPEARIVPIQDKMSSENLQTLIPEYDLVIDGLDRLEKKFFLNDWCVKLGKPYVHAGVVKLEGQVLAITPGQTACLRCLLPKIPPPFAMPTCQEAGVLGAFSQTIGYLQAREALRLARKMGPYRLWKMDAGKRISRSIIPNRNPDCSACGLGQTETLRDDACATPG
jgi:adenylyltransferase/sulfurtransferase